LSLFAEIRASFVPGQYPGLSRMPWLRVAGVLFLMTSLIVLALGFRVTGVVGDIRSAADEWLRDLPEMTIHQGRLSSSLSGPVFIEGPDAVLAIDPGDVLDLHRLGQDYSSFVVLRSTEIAVGGRTTAVTGRPYPYSENPITTDDLRGFAGRFAQFVPVMLLVGGAVVWVWLGAAQLLWATVLSAGAYLLTSGSRPRPSYARLWSLAGHALVPVICLSVLNVSLRFRAQNLGLGWVGPGAAVVFCALGVNALLHEEPAPPAGPPAGGGGGGAPGEAPGEASEGAAVAGGEAPVAAGEAPVAAGEAPVAAGDPA